MHHHHKFFSVRDESGKLLPYFVSITNGEKDADLVRKGNERVLAARFSDALFFLAEDQKRFIRKVEPKALAGMVFHARIGTYAVKRDCMLSLLEKSQQVSLVRKERLR